MSDYTMADFRAERYRRKHGVLPTPLVTRPALIGNRNQRRTKPETYDELCARVTEAARARIAVLELQYPLDTMPCPWGAIFDGECLTSCKCRLGGTPGTVTVAFMVAHCRLVLARYGGKR